MDTISAGRTVKAIPLYFVVDCSYSMTEGDRLGAVNRYLSEFLQEASSNPLLRQTIFLSIISFSDDANVELPLTRVDSVRTYPRIEARGGTSYGAAFRLLRKCLTMDVDALKANRLRVFRPYAVFLSDGWPTDDGWERDLEALQPEVFDYWPTFMALGVGSASPTSIAKIAGDRGKGFVSRGEVESLSIESFLRSAAEVVGQGAVDSPQDVPLTSIAIPTSLIPLNGLSEHD